MYNIENIKPRNISGINIEAAEKHYGVRYIGTFCLNHNGWCNTPAAIFYQPEPDRSKGHTNYLAIFIIKNNVILADGSSAFKEPIDACIADNGQIIYSSHRHDYVTSDDGSVFIDGGRDYTRTNSTTQIYIECIDGLLKFKPTKVKYE